MHLGTRTSLPFSLQSLTAQQRHLCHVEPLVPALAVACVLRTSGGQAPTTHGVDALAHAERTRHALVSRMYHCGAGQVLQRQARRVLAAALRRTPRHTATCTRGVTATRAGPWCRTGVSAWAQQPQKEQRRECAGEQSGLAREAQCECGSTGRARQGHTHRTAQPCLRRRSSGGASHACADPVSLRHCAAFTLLPWCCSDAAPCWPSTHVGLPTDAAYTVSPYGANTEASWAALRHVIAVKERVSPRRTRAPLSLTCGGSSVKAHGGALGTCTTCSAPTRVGIGWPDHSGDRGPPLALPQHIHAHTHRGWRVRLARRAWGHCGVAGQMWRAGHLLAASFAALLHGVCLAPANAPTSAPAHHVAPCTQGSPAALQPSSWF